MVDQVRLPVKVIIPRDDDLRAHTTGGGGRKLFGEVTEQTRSALIGQLDGVREYFSSVFADPSSPPAVAKVVLKKEALAKSHRPHGLFRPTSCPIIGGKEFGNLLVSVGPDGLNELTEKLSSGTSDAMVADISTVQQIEPYTISDVLGGIEASLLGEAVMGEGTSLKCRLFRHRSSVIDDLVKDRFLELARGLQLPDPVPIVYSDEMTVFRIDAATPELVTAVATFVGTQNLGVLPRYRLTEQYIRHRAFRPDDLPAPATDNPYPIVGLLDSGTDAGCAPMQAWVEARDEIDVPPGNQKNDHGSFIACLMANGRALNHGDDAFPATQAKVLDVVVYPECGCQEDELLQSIERALTTYPQVRVWNLSISDPSCVCQDGTFSDFAIALDRLQRQHSVTFAICAGNFSERPFRGWPPEDLGEDDRLFPPADSVMAVTVGALAHLDHAAAKVRAGQPAPFSRRGPGPSYIPKPEVVHVGGNCDADGDCRQIGILSIDGSQQLVEDVGTSFSTPLAAVQLAGLHSAVISGLSQNLAKALLIQAAALNSGPVDQESFRYSGFGVPGDPVSVLTCEPWRATLIFEPRVESQRRIFAKTDFPIPACFRRSNGSVEGEVLMTLVYDPPLDPAAGAEYCQANVDVSLGTYDPDTAGVPRHCGKIPLEKGNYSLLYEQHLVKHGFKWSPVKVYRKRLVRVRGDNWRLLLTLLHRDESVVSVPQNIALVVTLSDPKRTKPVYDDVVTAMNLAGWISQDLQIEERIRVQP